MNCHETSFSSVTAKQAFEQIRLKTKEPLMLLPCDLQASPMIRETGKRRAPKQCQESPRLKKKKKHFYIYKKETKSEDKMQSELICQVLPGIWVKLFFFFLRPNVIFLWDYMQNDETFYNWANDRKACKSESRPTAGQLWNSQPHCEYGSRSHTVKSTYRATHRNTSRTRILVGFLTKKWVSWEACALFSCLSSALFLNELKLTSLIFFQPIIHPPFRT